ncbi:MAG: S24 family peptidase [Desulfomonilaceae bacterium]
MTTTEELLRAAEIAARILSFRPKDRHKKPWLNEGLGVPYRTFRDWEEGRFYPSDKHLRHIAEKLDVPRRWLEYGEGDAIALEAMYRLLREGHDLGYRILFALTKDPEKLSHFKRSKKRVFKTFQKSFSVAQNILSRWSAGEILTESDFAVLKQTGEFFARSMEALAGSDEFLLLNEFVLPPRSEVHLAADGGLVVEHGIREHHAFRRDRLETVASSYENVTVMKVRGNSMWPTVCDGDVILVDRGQTTIEETNIYAIRIGEKGWVCRLQKNGEYEIKIISDNKRSKEGKTRVIASKNVHIIGRVIWLGRGDIR